jgi:hypothetical protein
MYTYIAYTVQELGNQLLDFAKLGVVNWISLLQLQPVDFFLGAVSYHCIIEDRMSCSMGVWGLNSMGPILTFPYVGLLCVLILFNRTNHLNRVSDQADGRHAVTCT